MNSINLIILICAGLAVASVFTSVIAFRAGAPLLLLFLAIGLLAGRNGPGGIVFTDARAAFLIGSAALAVILFDSGFHTGFKSYRQAAAPAILLATFGVAITAAVVALAGHSLLDLTWPQALLLGTVLSSTDAAALFFLLRVGGITIRDRVRSTLEVESGTNDPVAAALTMTAVGLLAGGDIHWVGLAPRFAAEMGGGALFGLAGGTAIVLVVNRLKLEPGLYPVVVMSLAILIFALTNLVGGSGFLAAYLAGLVAGNARLQWAGALRRFQEGITWLAQIAMFVTLGLLATPSHFFALAAPGALAAVALIFIARPIAVYICLAPFHFSKRERFFIAWVGLRGAVSILLGLLPMLGGIPGGEIFFDISFLVVVASLVVQGWTVRPLARWLGLIVPERSGPADRMEIDLPGLADRELVAYVLHPDSGVAQGRSLPRWARPLLVRRGQRVLSSPRQLLAGDRVYLMVPRVQVSLLDTLFGRSRGTGDTDTALYGDFAVGPEIPLGSLREAYDLPLSDVDDRVPLSELFRREFRTDIELGDRLQLGPVDLIVRDMRDGKITSVGISLEPWAKPQIGWERFKTRLSAILGIPAG